MDPGSLSRSVKKSLGEQYDKYRKDPDPGPDPDPDPALTDRGQFVRNDVETTSEGVEPVRREGNALATVCIAQYTLYTLQVHFHLGY